MTVGNSADKGGLNVKLGDAAVSIRDATAVAEELWGYIVSLGADGTAQKAALVTLGFTSTEADTYWNQANYTYALYQLYHGAISQGSTFNYHDGLAGARGAS